MELQVGGTVSTQTHMLLVLTACPPFRFLFFPGCDPTTCPSLLLIKAPLSTFDAPPPTPISRHYIGDPDISLAKDPRLNRTRQKTDTVFLEMPKIFGDVRGCIGLRLGAPSGMAADDARHFHSVSALGGQQAFHGDDARPCLVSSGHAAACPGCAHERG